MALGPCADGVVPGPLQLVAAAPVPGASQVYAGVVAGPDVRPGTL